MTNSENNHHATEGTADLPQSPPGAPEGHDAAPGGPERSGTGRAADQRRVSPRRRRAGTALRRSPRRRTRRPSPRRSCSRCSTLADKADEYLRLAQRKQAEFENFRKRAARETTVAQERGATKLAKEMLPAVDNLERALQHAPEDDDDHGFVAGVKHVHTDLIAALQRAGIEQFSPQGEQFDPTLHEAIAQTPIEGADPGTVVEVYQRGYRVGETVVRPARVVVAG